MDPEFNERQADDALDALIRAGANLTVTDISHINEHQTCPDCREGHFLEGPWGGNSVNVRCDHCGHEFWLGLGGSPVWIGQRLHRDKPGLYKGRLRLA